MNNANNSTKTSNGKDRIDLLRDKQKQIQAQLGAALEAKRKHEAMLNKNICMALGDAVMQTAEQNEGFRTMIAQTIGSVVTDDKTRKLLATRGLI